MRTFIAIDTSDALKSQLADLQSRIRKAVPNLKFTAPHQLHLTLKFLGAIDVAQQTVAQPPPAVGPNPTAAPPPSAVKLNHTVAEPPPAVSLPTSDNSQLSQITRALESVAARHKPFDLIPKTLGTFGRPTNITVLWLGLTDPSNTLHQLHADLERTLAPLGFPPEERPFKPHLTLARNKSPNLSRHIRQALDAEPPFKAVPQHVTAVTLYQSTLRQQGSVYTPLSRHDFKS